MKTSFRAVILAFGNNTGIEVPPEHLAELGKSKRPPVLVTVDSYSFRSTVGAMGGKSLIPFAKAHRDASGLKARDEVSVTLELDDGPREVDVPAELHGALQRAGLSGAFAALSYSKRKDLALRVGDAKTPATRDRRIEAALEAAR